MLNCYYARGEENPNFQRRCYSMLEPDLMHNVFVHYLDVKMTCTSSTLASLAVLLEPSSSLLGLEPDERNEIFKQSLQVSIPGKKLKLSCSYSGHQSAKPPWGEAQLQQQQATSQFSFGNGVSMERDISLSLARSESPSGKGNFNHLSDDVLDSATAGFPFHDGVGPLNNDKMHHLLGCRPQIYCVPDTPSADSRDTCASKYISVLEYPSIVSCGSDDHGFQYTGASGIGNIDFLLSDINNEDFSTLLHQSSMSDDLQVLLGSIDFGPSDSNEEDSFPSEFPGLHQSSTSDDLQFDEVLFWRARRRWTKVCGALKFLAVWKAAALRRSFTLHHT